MHSFLKTFCLTASLAAASLLQGTTIGYVYPAGAKAGDTVQVIVGGQALWAVRNLLIDGGGVKLVKWQNAPGTFYAGCGEQNNWAREYMRRVYAGEHLQPFRRNPRNFGVWRYNHFMEQLDQLDPLMLSLACKGIFERPNSLQASPAIGQKIVLTLKIDKEAKPGRREFRLIGSGNNLRVTNPLAFFIGTVPEYREQNYQMPPLKRKPVTFTVPSAVNGQIEPGEVDHFKFNLKKGEKCHFVFWGRKLNPFIGDGVPGNFQPILEVKDAAGKSLAFADDNYFDPDPVLNFQAPADGLYTLEIRDALYRGREDFVYRIDVKKGFYTRPGIAAPKLGIPESCEHIAVKEVNTLPCLISGTISKPGEEKIFRFKAEKGQRVVTEIYARRLGSPLDSIITVCGPDGKQIAVNDDFNRPNIGLNMQHIDSYICFKAPASGIYTVKVGDTAKAGNKDHVFYLRLDRPRPDFRVYLVPSAMWVSQDTAPDPVKVVVERLDGFKGEISFEMKNASGVTLAGINSIPAGADESQLSFSTGWIKRAVPIYPELYAVHGKTRRKVCGADAAMQAFAYTHYVPARKFGFFRTWLHGYGDRVRFAPNFNHRINLKQGQSASVEAIYIPSKNQRSPQLEFTLPDPPQGVSFKVEKMKNNRFKLIFTADKKAPKCSVNAQIKVKYTMEYYDNRRKEWRKSVNTFPLPMLRITVR